MAETAAPGTMLDREFLNVRCRLLDVAAALDRIDRAGDSDQGDVRRQQIRDALAILADNQTDRAERLQMLCSVPYDDRWRQRYGL
jgi:hypothetical protein